MFSTIRNQLLIFGLAAATFIALLAGAGLYAMNNLKASLAESSRSVTVIRNLLQGDMMHDAIRGDVFGALLAAKAGNAPELTEYTDETVKNAAEFLGTVDANLGLHLSEEIDADLTRLRPQVAQYTATAVSVTKEFSSDAAAAERRIPEVMSQFQELESQQAGVRDRIEAHVKAAEEAATAQARSSTVLLSFVALTAILTFGFFGSWLYKRITDPLDVLRGVVDKVNAGDTSARAHLKRDDELGTFANAFDNLLDERIAALEKSSQENEQLNNSAISILQAVFQLSQRDLTVRAPVTQDVIGTVSDSINALTDETSRVLHGVTDIAGQVQRGSNKVKTQADLVSQTAADERESVSQMVEALSEATLLMNQVALVAEQSNESAEQATQITNAALDTVNGTVKGMESIRETIAETEKRIKRLGERSQEISGIVNLINTISERTHVLALNASMQAAVAGDAGRGFAVVAEEVQRLAESSRTATQQIASLVNNIQLETNDTITTVNRTITQVVHGSEQAQAAGEQMRRTQAITSQLVAQVRRIAVASGQQKDMSAQLLQSVQRIGLSTERTAQQIDVQNQETDSLLASARHLVESVSVFKLPALA